MPTASEDGPRWTNLALPVVALGVAGTFLAFMSAATDGQPSGQVVFKPRAGWDEIMLPVARNLITGGPHEVDAIWSLCVVSVLALR